MPQGPNVIRNPSSGSESPGQGGRLHDRDILNDVLLTEKYLTDGFNVFARETSYSTLHTDVEGILFDTHKAARDSFNMMFQKGWYVLEGVDKQKIQQEQQTYSGHLAQFPYQSSLQ